MTATFIGNNRATRDAFVPPPTLNEDGSPVKWRMFFDGGARIADANTLSEIIDVLIDGYAVLDSEEQRHAVRNDYLLNLRNSMRAFTLASVEPEAWENMSDVEQYALANEEDFGPDFDMGEGEPFVWKQNYPLILMVNEFSPYTSLVAPLSAQGSADDVTNLFWMKNDSELEFLDTLNRAGVVTFGKPRAVNRTPKALRKE